MTVHISARLAWHDSCWNGCICESPISNTSCMVHEYIRDSRDDIIEISEAGHHISKVKNYQPPCSRDILVFSPFPSKIVHYDPLDWRRLPPVSEELPPYSFCTSPYGRMFSEKLGMTWESDPEEQRRRLKEYFDPLEARKSLVFFYTNHGNPLIEEKNQRLLIGVARIKEIGEQRYFPKTSRFPDEYPLWSRRITIKYPQETLRLPYQEYLAGHYDPSNIICRVPNAVREQFSYVSEHLTDDQAVIVLERLLQSVKAVLEEEKIPGDWKSRINWINKLLAETWKNRGAYPGIGSVLEYLGAPRGTIYQLEVLRQISLEGKDAKKHTISILNGRRKPEKKFQKDFEVAQRSWQDLPDSRKDLLETLCLFELTKEQVERVTNSHARREAGIKATDSDIIENPYVLCEQDEGGKNSDPIGLEQIDHGMIPHPDVAKAWSERVPITPNDKRRVRALLVDVLQSAAREGDTLLSLEDALARVKKRLPEERNCNPDPELILGLSDFYLKALVFDPESEHPFVALRQLRDMEIEVSIKIKELVSSQKKPPTNIDWKKRLEEEIGAVDKTHLRSEVEARAREEKASALEKMFVHRFSVLTGRAGTGKTLAAKILVQAIKEKGEDVLLLAPTGKARVRLQKMTETEAKTIHQFLYENKWIRSDTYAFRKSGGIKVRKSTVLVDEASMIPLDLLATLFRAINFHAIKRFILIGDPNQLPPIGPGRPFIDIVNWLDEDDERRGHLAYLHERARQEKTDSEALKLSDGYTREIPTSNDDEILSDIALGYDKGDLEVHIWNDTFELYSILEERMNELLGLDKSEKSYVAFNNSLGIESENERNPESWQILSPVRMHPFGTTEINRKIQRKYREGLMEAAKRRRRIPHPFGNQQIVWTDKVIQLVNGPRTAWDKGRNEGYVANGEIGYVKSTSKGRKRNNDCFDVAFSSQPSVTYRYYRPEVDENLELAYAITVHKAQGSDFDIVFLIIPQKAMTLSRELFYTGLTRFKKKLVLLVEKDITSLREFRSLNRSETLRRNTNLFKPIVRPEDVELPYPENLIHRTLTNVLVRSKSEVVVANILTKLGIDYEYEKPLEFAPDDFRLPDFTIHYKGKTYYWEHLGMLNLPSYMRDWMRKKKWYEKHNLFDKVITSQDGPDGAINSIEIERIATERILKSD